MAGPVIFPYDPGAQPDLIIDAIYRRGPHPHKGGDAIAALLPCGNSGGFRPRRADVGKGWAFVALYSLGDDADWPDTLDLSSGLFTYYGDNKTPGKELHDTSRRGNRILREVFAQLHADPPAREGIPPFFVFTGAGSGDVQFRGLVVPGAQHVPESGDLQAIWRTSGRQRFQNYRAIFTMLDVPVVTRQWINDLLAAKAISPAAPTAWTNWVKTGRIKVMTSPGTSVRSKESQLPANAADARIIEEMKRYFRAEPTRFEACADLLFRLLDRNATDTIVTRPRRDGGRDVIGYYDVGPVGDRVRFDFALEAKLYDKQGVGVKETARLISRLRHRQFGVLVTTSFLGPQAYKEIRADAHPVVIITARDIVDILRESGIRDVPSLRSWLVKHFP